MYEAITSLIERANTQGNQRVELRVTASAPAAKFMLGLVWTAGIYPKAVPGAQAITLQHHWDKEALALGTTLAEALETLEKQCALDVPA